MRVALVNRFYPGGQTTHVEALACALAAADCEVLVAYVGRPGPWATARPIRTLSRAFGPPGQIESAIGAFRPDIIHSHSQHVWALAGSAAAASDVPHVITVHRRGLDDDRDRPHLAAASLIVFPGPKTQQSVDRRLTGRSVVIGNGVDLDRFRPGQKTPRITAAYVGRVDRPRSAGFQAFIEATRGLDIDAQFLGQSSVEVDCEHVERIGWSHDPQTRLAATHIVVATGRSLIEGLACGAASVVLGEDFIGPVSPELVAAARAPPKSLYFNSAPALASGAMMAPALRQCLEDLTRCPARLAWSQRFARETAIEYFDQRHKTEQMVAAYRLARERHRNGRVPARAAAATPQDAVLARLERQRQIVDRNLARAARWCGPLRREIVHARADADRMRLRGAFDELVASVRRNQPIAINADWLRHIHDRAVGGRDFRTRNVRIGRYRGFAPPGMIEHRIDGVLATLNNADWPPAYAAAWAHAQLVLIHPFADGNGRVARLVASLVLLQAGYRSTLFTAVEQHSWRAPRRYVATMSRLVPDGENDGIIVRLVEMMAERSSLIAAWRARCVSLEAACIRLGVAPAKVGRVLLDYDLAGAALPRRLARGLGEVSAPWQRMRQELSPGDRDEFCRQLQRLCDEERADRETTQ